MKNKYRKLALNSLLYPLEVLFILGILWTLLNFISGVVYSAGMQTIVVFINNIAVPLIGSLLILVLPALILFALYNLIRSFMVKEVKSK